MHIEQLAILLFVDFSHFCPSLCSMMTIGSNPTPFGYTGEMLDSNGLAYHRARYYDADRGVWMSEDPLELGNRYAYVDGNSMNDAVGEPKFMNGYGYTNANPVNFVDSTGLIGERPETWNQCTPQQSECCCGYDVTEWFLAELHIHGVWAYRNLITRVIDRYGVIWYGGFRDYAKSIPYKWMRFDTGLSRCPSLGCERGVTLCGKCIDRSELGNIVFGASGAIIGIRKFVLEAAAKAVGALKEDAEMAGLDIGYEIGTDTNYRSIFDETELCSFITSRTPTAWRNINFGQDPDVSQCSPCNDVLPADGSIIPHTQPSLDITNYEGTSVWADDSRGEGDLDDPFFTNQIPGSQWLAPELCADATMYGENELALCGTE